MQFFWILASDAGIPNNVKYATQYEFGHVGHFENMDPFLEFSVSLSFSL